MRIELRVSAQEQRLWHESLYERLRVPETEVHVQLTQEPRSRAYRRLQRLLWLEQRLHRLGPTALHEGNLTPPRQGSSSRSADITLDLTPRPLAGHWTVLYDGRPGEQAAVDALRAGHLPIVSVVDNFGVERASGRPGSEQPTLLATALSDISAGVISLVVGAVLGSQFATPDLDESTSNTCDTGQHDQHAPQQAPRSYTALAARRVIGAGMRFVYRMGFRAPHWRVGWRPINGPSALTSGKLDGPLWSEVPDDGYHFYADPFPFEHQGRTYLFVEDFDHRIGKGVISVAPWGANGPTGPFEPVLQHEVHLSYPFVLEHDGEVWMVPETSGAGRIELYLAVDFPRRWERHSVLIDNVVASDATPFSHEGRWWMTATVGLGGSLSDSLYLWSAPDLLGPWTAHRANPVLIDIASARPAGRVEQYAGRLLRPVQDGRTGYGAAMSVAEITRLDDTAFAQTIVARYSAGGPWAGSRVHTLNQSGTIETIDGSRLSPRFRYGSQTRGDR